MKKRLVYKANVRWGTPIMLISMFIVLLTAFFAFYLVQLIIMIVKEPLLGSIIIAVVFSIPIILLNIVFYPVIKTLFLAIFKKSHQQFELYTTGLKIKNKFLAWDKVKSISFHTGRIERGEEVFFRKVSLPALQKIFILDKEGKEYSCVIDIDYFLKENREKNNYRKLRELLLGMDKMSLISDWAEKR